METKNRKIRLMHYRNHGKIKIENNMEVRDMNGYLIGMMILLIPFLIAWIHNRFIKKKTMRESIYNCISGGMIGILYIGVAIGCFIWIVSMVLNIR